MNRARHQRRDLQTVDAVLRGDRRQDHDERARGPGDLDAAPAQRRHQEASDDGGVEALLRLRARRDRERHCERQRDHADDQP
jgi:hypothetical protein